MKNIKSPTRSSPTDSMGRVGGQVTTLGALDGVDMDRGSDTPTTTLQGGAALTWESSLRVLVRVVWELWAVGW